MVIEVIVSNHQSVINAKVGGANKIELCSSLFEGALTPSVGFVKFARNNFDSEINVMIRPRGGDFLYSEKEFYSMKYDIKKFKKIGVDGIVFGFLNKNGDVDTNRTLEIIERSYPLKVTFNRAFDVSNNPYKSIKDLIKCNCSRLLTAGFQSKAEDGVELIGELIVNYGPTIDLVPGGGINENNITYIAKKTKAKEFHINIQKTYNSLMQYQSHNVKLTGIPNASDYELQAIDIEKLLLIKQILNNL